MKGGKTVDKNVPNIDTSHFFGGGLNFHVQRSDEYPDYVGIVHSHDFIEIAYIISGSGRHIIGNNEYIVKRGDVSVINCGEAHAFFADEDNSEEFLVYDLMFTPDFVDSTLLGGDDFSHLADSFLFYSVFTEGMPEKERLNLVQDCAIELGGVFESIYHEFSAGRSGFVNLIRIYIAEIIIKLFRKLESSEQNRLTSEQRKVVSQAVDYIRDNYSIRLSTEDIASKMFFNRNYLSKLFKAQTGLSVREFIKKIRLEQAIKLLRETDLTISQISQECGFSDIKNFYNAFESYAGCTPKNYRNSAEN